MTKMSKKDAIKQVAFQLFAEKGYDSTSTEDIASRLGLTKQTLYSHFSSKKEIFLQVLQGHSDIIRAELSETYDRYQDAEIDVLLKEIFKTIIRLFSNRQLLLFWKRLTLINRSADSSDFFENYDWKIEQILFDKLYAAICARNEALKESAACTEYLFAYILLLNGYMDWLLCQEHDEQRWERIWDKFCKGFQESSHKIL